MELIKSFSTDKTIVLKINKRVTIFWLVCGRLQIEAQDIEIKCMATMYIGKHTHTHSSAPTFLIGLPTGLYSSLKTVSCIERVGKKNSVNLKMPLWWVPTATICSFIVYDTFVTLTFAGLFMLLVKEDKKVNKKVTIKLSYIQDVLCLLMVKKSL